MTNKEKLLQAIEAEKNSETIEETGTLPVVETSEEQPKKKKKAALLLIPALLAAGLGGAYYAGAFTPSVEEVQEVVQEQPPIQQAVQVEVVEEVEIEDLDAQAVFALATENLEFDSRDVSSDPLTLEVEVKDGVVVVTEVADMSAKERIVSSAEKSAALANAIAERTVAGQQLSRVTWLSADNSRTIQVAITQTPTRATAAKELYANAGSYAIADSVYKDKEVEALELEAQKTENDVVDTTDAPIEIGKTTVDEVLHDDIDNTVGDTTGHVDVKEERFEETKDEQKTDEKQEEKEADKQEQTNSQTVSANTTTNSNTSGSSTSNSSSSSSSKNTNSTNNSSSQRRWVVDVAGHYEQRQTGTRQVVTGQKWVVDQAAWEEPVYEEREYWLVSDGKVFYDDNELHVYLKDQAVNHRNLLSYGLYSNTVLVNTIYHEEQGHYEDVYGTEPVYTQVWVEEQGHWE